MSKYPQAVVDAASATGGYLGADVRYFNIEGREISVPPQNLNVAGYVVVANAYGYAVFKTTPRSFERIDSTKQFKKQQQ